MSGLIPNASNANDDYRMPQYGIGFTNIVQRPSKAGSDITKYRDEIESVYYEGYF
jgi:TDG/mug DNA glycosylase family protein